MNLKSISNISNPMLDKVSSVKKETKAMDTSADRDPQQGNHGGQQEQQNFTEEDLQKALEYLKNHPGIKKNNLSVVMEKQNEALMFLVKDYQGKVVRRLSAFQAIESSRAANADTEDKRGGILNKAV
ncbi:MAG: hypothetical protein CL674_00505 [Bdellovibrionaceae bacterium]|nr:hypothetical protein [Pseudobdellovibrionaceae bacterium]